MTENDVIEGLMEEGSQAMPTIQTKSSSIIDTIKENLTPNTLVNKIKTSKDRLFEVALYGGIGFISGFLLKRYSTYIGVSILVLIGLGALHHFGIINIVVNWHRVNQVFGIQTAHNVTADNILAIVWEWVKVNMVISISYVVCFFIGLKVG